MSNKITVVDYGVGNLLSVRRALEKVGAEVLMTESAKDIDAATRLLLPGVGAFVDGMTSLKQRGLVEPLRNYAKSGKPFLGICLGMQMLFESSEEFESCEGLGILKGEVKLIPSLTTDGKSQKIPHIGWVDCYPAEGSNWNNSHLKGLPVPSSFYFLHSFTAFPKDPHVRLADCKYGGQLISAAVSSKNIYGCQFHPEKSGTNGLHVLKNFLSL